MVFDEPGLQLRGQCITPALRWLLGYGCLKSVVRIELQEYRFSRLIEFTVIVKGALTPVVACVELVVFRLLIRGRSPFHPGIGRWFGHHDFSGVVGFRSAVVCRGRDAQPAGELGPIECQGVASDRFKHRATGDRPCDFGWRSALDWWAFPQRHGCFYRD